tara:strand:+ start:860 stop:1102 length:243 start_codon:yes stop_codon:yes gene_type:complete
MSDSIITSVFTLSGTILGGLISYLIARNTREIKILKYQVSILSNQIISYWNLEKVYSEEISNAVIIRGKIAQKPMQFHIS